MKDENTKYFKGKYYKFVSQTGFTFAVIDAVVSDKKIIQIVDDNKSYLIKDYDQVKINDDQIVFNINQDDLTLIGKLDITNLHPLKKDVMGILRKFKCIKCKHNIFSMYHDVNGFIRLNDKYIPFDNSFGYIEGDEGISFPRKYLWFNYVSKDIGITVSVAELNLWKNKTFIGCFVIVKDKDKEYVFSTLNGLKIEVLSKYYLSLRKGKYSFEMGFPSFNGHKLLAPKDAEMKTTIHEAISVRCSFAFMKGNKNIVEKNDVLASFERVNL